MSGIGSAGCHGCLDSRKFGIESPACLPPLHVHVHTHSYIYHATRSLPGDSIVAAVYRKDNQWAFEEWFPQDHDATIAAFAERAFLDSLDKSSPWTGRPPLAGLMERSRISKHKWMFRGLLARPDGSRVLKASAIVPGDGTKAHAEVVGFKIGLELLDKNDGSNVYD
jgi:hypothetical protein